MSDSINNPVFKLYVVGEDTPDPDKWSIWSEMALVIARTAEEAMELAGKSPATEIPMDKPLYLLSMPEPAWGDDL